jgi:hypothetical protein
VFDSSRPSTSILRSTLLITLATIILVAAVAALLDNRCYSSLRADDVPRYPNATLVSDAHQFLGASRVVYETSDSASDVQAWYNQQIATFLRAGVVTGQSQGTPIWASLYTIEAGENGQTQIVFSAMCP